MKFEPQVVNVSLTEIIPNRFQPRLSFDEKAMEELTASIKEHGIIQPLVLRRVGDKYEIIAGERRFKASGLAGLTEVPAIITNLDDNNSAEVALVENVQRKNLTPIEEAKSYKVLLDRGYLTQEELAKKIGVSQSSVANKLRLLNLDEEVQQSLVAEKISERHARSLLQLSSKEKQKEFLNKILSERMTVRQLDAEIAQLQKEVSVVDDAPLIEVSPSIEEIKNNAEDINPIKQGLPIESLLVTEESKSNEIASQTENKVPIIEETQNNQTGRFFNFLEDEEANMNVEEPTIISEAGNPFAPNSQVELLDSNINPLPTDLPNIESPAFSNNATIEAPSPIIDPVNQIETLDPNYVPPLQKEINEYDIPEAISFIRNTVNEIAKQGLKVDLEELDLDNLYQVVIKIDKKTEE